MNGLTYIDNFIDIDTEISIISKIEDFRITNPKSVANYGSNNYDSIYFGERYKKNNLDFPEYLNSLCLKLIEQKFFDEMPFGIAINKYKKGQKIAAHIDKAISGPIVTILSLGSSSTMLFKKDKNIITQELKPRSVIQMRDEIRNTWTHEILPVKNTRYSIIFRSLQ